MRNEKCGMRNAECRMQNAELHSSFLIHHSSFIIPLLFLALFFSPSHRLAANPYDFFYHSPYTVEPDTTKVIYPIPVNTGNPLWDLNNQSPLYLNDPSNFETEIIYLCRGTEGIPLTRHSVGDQRQHILFLQGRYP